MLAQQPKENNDVTNKILTMDKIKTDLIVTQGFPGGSAIKNLPANEEDLGLIPESRRSSGEGNDNSFQHSCLGNPMDRGTWWATVYVVTEGNIAQRLKE